MRRGLWGAVTAVLLLSLPSPAHADDPASSRSSAQQRANKAAARLSQAQTDLAKAESGLGELQARVKRGEERLAALRGQVQDVAVREYMRGGTVPLFFSKDVNSLARVRAMVQYVTLGDIEAIERYRSIREDLQAASGRLNKQLKAQRAAVAQVQAEQKAALGELERLAAEERAAEARKAAAAARAAQTQPASRQAPTPAAPAAGRPTGQIASGPWVCPVQGPHSFSNDYGAARPGGRSHQGNDILSPRGTPVVMNVSGTLSHNFSGRGGNSYFLHGDDGKTYFGAHLDSYSGATGRLPIGTVIGYVGTTGDAAGGPPHLHFEMHVGGSPVNPYSTLTKYC
jgi:peptidoglycan LD-endopeptidase LytH